MNEKTPAASAPPAAATLPSLADVGDLLPGAMAVLGADDGFRYANARFVDLLGLANDRPRLPALLEGISGLEPESIARQLRGGGEHVFERGERTLALRGQKLDNGALLLTVEDLGSHGAAAAYAEKLAHHDPLTGLGNRSSVRIHLETALRHAARLSVFCLDLDHFKLVNDTLGHLVGDKLLQRVAERLRSMIGTDGDIARLGGDEFAIVLPGAERDEAASLAKRIVDLVGRAYLVDEHLINIGVSIGVAFGPDDGDTSGDLLKHADLALYHAKARGRACFCFFQPEMNARLLARRALEFELRKALGLRQFELHYQPQLNLERGRVESVEALLRWNHPDRGRVSPADFIPLAEELGLIIPIGEWVIRTACKDAAAWPDHIKVAVNLSPVQFTSGRLFGVVKSALEASKLAPDRLELEITESALLNDSPATLKTLHQIRGLGVRISMDDFGTGYSSLSYLRSFPFDKIKIDQSFVRGIESSNDCIAIVRAIAGLASTLGMSTTAEGVETAAQLDRVRAEGCTDIQGYLISKPVPLDELERLIEAPPAFRAA